MKTRHRRQNAFSKTITVEGEEYSVNRVCRKVRMSSGISDAVYLKRPTRADQAPLFMSSGGVVAIMSEDQSIVLVATGGTVDMRERTGPRAADLARSLCSGWSEVEKSDMRDPSVRAFLMPETGGPQSMFGLAADGGIGIIGGMTSDGRIAQIDVRKALPTMRVTISDFEFETRPERDTKARILSEEARFALADMAGCDARARRTTKRAHSTDDMYVHYVAPTEDHRNCAVAYTADVSAGFMAAFGDLIYEEAKSAILEYPEPEGQRMAFPDGGSCHVVTHGSDAEPVPEVSWDDELVSGRAKKSAWSEMYGDAVAKERRDRKIGGSRTFDPKDILDHARARESRKVLIERCRRYVEQSGIDAPRPAGDDAYPDSLPRLEDVLKTLRSLGRAAQAALARDLESAGCRGVELQLLRGML